MIAPMSGRQDAPHDMTRLVSSMLDPQGPCPYQTRGQNARQSQRDKGKRDKHRHRHAGIDAPRDAQARVRGDNDHRNETSKRKP